MNDLPQKPTRPSQSATSDTADAASAGSTEAVRLTASVFGLVQGVGFRDYVRTKGRRLGLVGSATNRPDGGVDVIAEGPAEACRALLELLVTGHTPGRTDRVEHVIGPATGGLAGFVRR
ncbi:acylphosphatase [Pseudofrankia sp. DC12]|uniref:acylphosphatase n=1 Tax=Pseudofrankia sp. DC12 TaxID=683315 RepID=UPI001E491AFF|nr:acylphosphatase [Pseudofrankia sp. DC12]